MPSHCRHIYIIQYHHNTLYSVNCIAVFYSHGMAPRRVVRNPNCGLGNLITRRGDGLVNKCKSEEIFVVSLYCQYRASQAETTAVRYGATPHHARCNQELNRSLAQHNTIQRKSLQMYICSRYHHHCNYQMHRTIPSIRSTVY